MKNKPLGMEERAHFLDKHLQKSFIQEFIISNKAVFKDSLRETGFPDQFCILRIF